MTNQLDNTSAIPLYRQLANVIRDSVECGEFEKDAQIPTEAILSRQYGISRITVRKALEELTEEGLLMRRQGKGTFVSAGKVISNNYPFTTFDDACTQSGKVPATKLLSYSLEAPTKKTAVFFGLPDSGKVIQIRRIRIADDTPVMIETVYFPSEFDFFAGESLVGSTGLILNKYNIFPIHGESTTTICYANEEESALFDLEPETPLLYIYSEIKDQNLKPIEVSKQVIRPDLYKLIITY